MRVVKGADPKFYEILFHLSPSPCQITESYYREALSLSSRLK
jgi:hypothetical protein